MKRLTIMLFAVALVLGACASGSRGPRDFPRHGKACTKGNHTTPTHHYACAFDSDCAVCHDGSSCGTVMTRAEIEARGASCRIPDAAQCERAHPRCCDGRCVQATYPPPLEALQLVHVRPIDRSLLRPHHRAAAPHIESAIEGAFASRDWQVVSPSVARYIAVPEVLYSASEQGLVITLYRWSDHEMAAMGSRGATDLSMHAHEAVEQLLKCFRLRPSSEEFSREGCRLSDRKLPP